jgi:hypothetical protein
MTQIVLENGLNASNQDLHGQTVMFYVSRDGRTDIIDLLIKYKVNPDL